MAQKRSVKLGGLDRRNSLVTEVDPDQVQQVLTNLVVNAIQATGPGGSVEIVVADKVVQPPPDRGGAPGKWHCIEVRDTGVGIAPDDLQLFEPFFTTKGVTRAGARAVGRVGHRARVWRVDRGAEPGRQGLVLRGLPAPPRRRVRTCAAVS
jgi:signal transduction histidine kinase